MRSADEGQGAVLQFRAVVGSLHDISEGSALAVVHPQDFQREHEVASVLSVYSVLHEQSGAADEAKQGYAENPLRVR